MEVTATVALCAAAGFEGVQRAAADCLADAFADYTRRLCQQAAGYAALSGRASITLNDVQGALEDAQVHLGDLERYLDHLRRKPTVELPLPEPAAPPAAFSSDAQALADAGPVLGRDAEVLRPAYIPDHLPPLPNKHAFQRSEATVTEELSAAERQRRWCDEQRQMAMNLHMLLLGPGDRGPPPPPALLEPALQANVAALPPFPSHLLALVAADSTAPSSNL